MPRYFFDFEDGAVLPDTEGTELPDTAAARKVALRILAEMLPSRAADLWREGSFRIQVSDDQHLLLFTVELSVCESPVLRSAS